MPAYPTSGATIRADINILVEEAAAADDFFIGARVMPPLPVDAKSGTYPKITTAAGELMSIGSTLRNRTSGYGEVSRSWTTDTYDCLDRGLEEPVDDTDQKDLSRFFNLEMNSARWVLRSMKLDHENRVATEVMNATTFGAGTNSVVAYTAGNIATIDIAQDILAAIERVANNGQAANTIVMSSTVFARIASATKTISWLRGTAGGNIQTGVNAANIAASFADYGIKNCYIGRARYNSAKKGQTKSMASIWGTTYIWVGVVNEGASTPADGGAGHTFVWNAEGGLFVSETYRDERRRSNMVRVRQNTTEKMVDSTAGTLITTQYS